MLKFVELMSSENSSIITKLANYTSIYNKKQSWICCLISCLLMYFFYTIILYISYNVTLLITMSNNKYSIIFYSTAQSSATFDKQVASTFISQQKICLLIRMIYFHWYCEGNSREDPSFFRPSFPIPLFSNWHAYDLSPSFISIQILV